MLKKGWGNAMFSTFKKGLFFILKIIERAIVMVIRYFWAVLVILTGIRFNDLKPLYKPYYGELAEGIAKDPKDPKNCWLLYDKKGERRGFWFPEILLSPAMWFVAIFIALDTGNYLSTGKNVISVIFYYFLVKTILFIVVSIGKDVTGKQKTKV